ncbi:hypothetical protein YC2023_042601 [Brassica napus]
MEFVLLPILSSTLCGSGVGNVLLKIRDISNTKVLIKGFVAMLKIVDYVPMDPKSRLVKTRPGKS